MSATAGLTVRVKVSGSALTLTGEATTDSGDHLTWQITDATKRVLDPTASITVKDGGTATAESYTLNRLKGTVTFGSANAARVITIDGAYLPMSTAAEAHGIDVTTSALNGDETTFTDTDIIRSQLSKDVSGTVSRFYSADTYFSDAFDAAAPTVVEVSRASGSTPFLRAWALWNKNPVSAATKGYVEESASFEGKADADSRSFTWLE